MTTTTAAQVLANTTTQIEAKGYTREEAFDIALAMMISEDPETMRALLEAGRKAYAEEMAA